MSPGRFLLAALLLLVGCGTARLRERSVTFGHSSGGPASIMTFVTIRSNGEAELSGSPTPAHARIDPLAAAGILAAMQNEEMRALLSGLRAQGYRSGCCDMEEIYIEVGRTVTEAPVRVQDRFAVPEKIVAVLHRVDTLAADAFGPLYSYRLAP